MEFGILIGPDMGLFELDENIHKKEGRCRRFIRTRYSAAKIWSETYNSERVRTHPPRYGQKIQICAGLGQEVQASKFFETFDCAFVSSER